VEVLVLSLDPYMRGRISSDPSKNSRGTVMPLGSVIPGASVGRVIASRAEGVPCGALVHCYSGWKAHYTALASQVDLIEDTGLPLEKYVGVLGMTGLTSFYGLTYVGQAKAGETVVVSGAAGAVGSVVVQIARIYGCRVVAIASASKLDYLHSLGVDAAIAYDQPAAELQVQLASALPGGVDVYFDNTGGTTSDLVIPLINKKARIVICGQISTYNDVAPTMGPRLLHHLLWKSARMEGFLVQDFQDKDKETHAQLCTWIKEGKLKSREDVISGGLREAPKAFLKLFDGSNLGKLVIKM